MRVLIVAPYFHPSIGGLENYALSCASGLAKAGHEVRVIASGPGSTVEEGSVGPVTILRLPATVRISNTPLGLRWPWQLRRALAAFRPDVINGHLPVPGIADLAARMAGGTPYVVTYHNDLIKGRQPAKAVVDVYNRAVLPGTLRRARCVIVTSAYYAGQSRLIPADVRTEVVPIGVDLRRFRPDGARRPRAGGSLSILFVSSLKTTHAHKGLDVLLRAVALVRRRSVPCTLTVVGGGDGRPGFEDLTRALGIEADVSFAGLVPDGDLPNYYAGADVFVLPSTSAAEGFGMVIAEAQACGTPVIAAAVGGIPAALDHGATGILVPPGDDEALASALQEIAKDPSGASPQVDAAMEKVRDCYSLEVQTRKLIDVLTDVVAGG